jgi:A/G-specific adenine glycosylase
LNFSAKLLAWAAQHLRPMPWKGERDPYKIWLSEIILQQTRVEQGLPYYERFVAAYPTVTDLAAAPSEAVMRLWQGLGYYSRARNLHSTAQYIRAAHGGVFPATYADIRELKGVGDYTAAAIASFAYELPYAVVDGNVYRVLSRIFGIFTPIDSTQGKKEFAILAQSLLNTSKSADYNQAIIDFGATHCTPTHPQCSTCPFNEDCQAFLITSQTTDDLIRLLPVKSKKNALKHRYFHYFYFGKNKQIWLQKRSHKDIWQDLWQLPLIETRRNFGRFKTFLPTKKQSKTLFDTATKNSRFKKLTKVFLLKIQRALSQSNYSSYLKTDFHTFFGRQKPVIKQLKTSEQTLSHQKIHCKFYIIENNIDCTLPETDGFLLVDAESLPNFALPKSIAQFLSSRA